MLEVHSDEKLTPVRVCYGTKSEQFGDLYLPKILKRQCSLHPVMILIHGGYWKDNHDLNSYATSQLIPELVVLGWAVWNIEYRRMDSLGANIKAPWPSVFTDVSCAVDAIRLFAEEYSLDTKNVSVIGHSAGGCLALWAASRQKIPVTSPLFNTKPLLIRRAMSICGVLSLTHPEDLCQPEQIMRLMGGTAVDWPERYSACDPAQLYDPAVSILLIHGDRDKTVKVHQAFRYIENGPNSIQLEVWSDTDHFSMLPHDGEWSSYDWSYLKARIRDFFNMTHWNEVNS